ncbi:hypothetical protein [Streptomyces sp. NPDC050759]|uniref:hypothetical protein n=1 Tax=Streptomyces sp. NPDC050759 TaxID=3365635 RepID=UPI0037B120FF
MIRETSAEQVKPLLEGISAGRPLYAIRRLVRVPREDDDKAARPGERLTEVDRRVSAFAGHDTEATLHAEEEAARGVRPAPEVETSVHRVVQETLTNARRHAPVADVAVRLELRRDSGGDRLRVEVRNTAPQLSAGRSSLRTATHHGAGRTVCLWLTTSAVDRSSRLGDAFHMIYRGRQVTLRVRKFRDG